MVIYILLITEDIMGTYQLKIIKTYICKVERFKIYYHNLSQKRRALGNNSLSFKHYITFTIIIIIIIIIS